jgi:23S rRNA pseudouridine1911/1915/1917 synthase
LLTVGPEHHGTRADKVIVALLQAAGQPATRADVQRWIGEGRVSADDRPIAKKTALWSGARIRVTPGVPPLSRAEPDPAVAIHVVYEDADVLVVDKQAGLVVHPARGHVSGTLVNGLLARGGFSAAGDPRDPAGHLRPGIVHRLDKDTSGLMVVAKHPRARELLKAELAARGVKRSYLALVVGAGRDAVYDTTHGRHPQSRMRFTSLLPDGEPGVRRARTRVTVSERYRGATLVRCELDTGRTHQIRVHLSEQAKTPILGDALYGARPRDPALAAIAAELGRQALHAAALSFTQPASGRPLSFESPLPADIERARRALSEL